MSANYLFSLQPTFTQGLVLGQLSIVLFLGLVLRYLFLDSTQDPSDIASYQPRVDADGLLRNCQVEPNSAKGESLTEDAESVLWLNVLSRQIIDIYRSKLRDDISGPEGDEIARKRVEHYVNRVRPSGFMDYIKIHSVDLGETAPTLCNARAKETNLTSPPETHFDATYVDTLSLSLSTSYLFNYPMNSFARLPISLTISLSQFKASICVVLPAKNASPPYLTLTISPNFSLDLTTTSLMGSRAKLANMPKLHELIQHQVRRVLASRATWKIALPGLVHENDVTGKDTSEHQSS